MSTPDSMNSASEAKIDGVSPTFSSPQEFRKSPAFLRSSARSELPRLSYFLYGDDDTVDHESIQRNDVPPKG